MQFLDKVVDIPVVVQRQVSTVQVVQKTVGRDERSNAERVRDCNRKSCGVSSVIDSLELKLRHEVRNSKADQQLKLETVRRELALAEEKEKVFRSIIQGLSDVRELRRRILVALDCRMQASEEQRFSEPWC